MYRTGLRLSLVTKLYIPIAFMMFLILGINSKNTLLAAVQLAAILALELAILTYIGSLRRIAAAIALITIFIGVGLAVRVISMILGYEPVALEDMAVSTLRVVEFFLAVAIAFQWIRVSEYGWIFRRMGLKNVATLFVITLTQLSPILIAYSEALTTIRLKYGGRVLRKTVKPLVIYSFNYGRDVAEAVYMYGIPEPNIEMMIGRNDMVMMLGLTVVLAGLGILPG